MEKESVQVSYFSLNLLTLAVVAAAAECTQRKLISQPGPKFRAQRVSLQLDSLNQYIRRNQESNPKMTSGEPSFFIIFGESRVFSGINVSFIVTHSSHNLMKLVECSK